MTLVRSLRFAGAVATLIALIVAITFVFDGDGDDPTLDAGSGDSSNPTASSVSVPTNSSRTDPDDTSTSDPQTDEPVAHVMPSKSQFEGVAVKIEPTISIALLTGMVWNDTEGAYYAISQDGLVHRVDRELSASEVVLDLSAEVSVYEEFSERGMLGIAFDPRDGRLFLDYTDRDAQTHIDSFAMIDGAPDVNDRRSVLFQEQPGAGHKGGQLAFDTDGNLYIAFGDGGGSRGRDAQDMSKLLGAIVRITPKLDGDGYDIPPTNPFATDASIRPEIYAKGLRNPWRFSIDRPTGDIWIGDVGEENWEEVDEIPAGTAGQNFGWYWKEGTHDNADGAIEGLTAPLFEYAHDDYGPAVIGGFVYHGEAIPELQGAYLFADMSGPMFAMGTDGVARLNIPRQTNGVITSWVVTPDNELLVITQRDAIYRFVAA
jgi:glucose/arabinose dehydrogenase